jgi:hypothetical protein
MNSFSARRSLSCDPLGGRLNDNIVREPDSLMMNTPRFWVLVGLCFVSGACNTSVDYADVRGSYRAMRANGEALPTPLVVGGSDRLVAGSLELRSAYSLLLILEKDSRLDTLSAHFVVSGDELLLSQIDAFPLELVDRVSIVSSRSVVVTVIYHFAPSSGLPPDRPVEILFWR